MKLSSPVVEVTISLSNVIKNTVRHIDDEKIIPIQLIHPRDEAETSNHPSPKSNENGEIIANAREEARKIIEQARHEAEMIRKTLEEEKEALAEKKMRVMQEAEEKGYAAGLARGEEAGYEQVTSLLEKARSLVAVAEADYRKTIARAEQTILAIGLAAAEKILHTELAENPEQFLSLVQGAIKEATNYKTIYVYVHPDHYPFLVEKKDELLPRYFHFAELYIYPDEKLQLTDCIIETEGERIVAGVDTQLEELKIQLFDLFTGDADESR